MKVPVPYAGLEGVVFCGVCSLHKAHAAASVRHVNGKVEGQSKVSIRRFMAVRCLS